MILLKGGLAFVNSKIVKKDILISEGKIKQLGQNIKAEKAEIINCKDKLILPGFIDGHVHFREPGMTRKEDFSSGSKAAAAGGITTIIDMPNNKPPILTAKALNEKRKLAKEKCIVNYGFHFGSSESNINSIRKVKKVASTKVFMNESTGKLKIEDKEKLEKIFEASRIISVHAEHKKVKEAVELAKKTKTKLYLCHISSFQEIRYLRKNTDKNIFIEVTPHHLFLTARKENNFLKVKPSLKGKRDIKALWRAIDEGLIDTIGTDHAPHTIKEKKSKDAPYGLIGEETFLPLMMDAVNKRKISLRKVIKLCCENPARIFDIKNKGFIKKEYDADLVIVDMKLKKRVDARKLFTKCKWSPYNKKLLKGWPLVTIVNGNIIFDKGKIDPIAAKEVEFK